MNRLFIIGFAIWAVVGVVFYAPKLFKSEAPPVVRGPMPTKKKVTTKAARRFRAAPEPAEEKEEASNAGGIYSNLQKKFAKIENYKNESESSGSAANKATRLGMPTSTSERHDSQSLAKSISVAETKPFGEAPAVRKDGYNPRGQRYEGAPAVHSERQGELESDRSKYLEKQSRAWTKDEVLVALNQIYQYVMERGGNYQTAFASLRRDVEISMTEDSLKADLLQQIKVEEKSYRDYFQGSR